VNKKLVALALVVLAVIGWIGLNIWVLRSLQVSIRGFSAWFKSWDSIAVCFTVAIKNPSFMSSPPFWGRLEVVVSSGAHTARLGVFEVSVEPVEPGGETEVSFTITIYLSNYALWEVLVDYLVYGSRLRATGRFDGKASIPILIWQLQVDIHYEAEIEI